MLLYPFHNVSHSNISHIHIDVNESIYIYILNLFGAPWCPGTMIEIYYIPNSNEYETFSNI